MKCYNQYFNNETKLFLEVNFTNRRSGSSILFQEVPKIGSNQGCELKAAPKKKEILK